MMSGMNILKSRLRDGYKKMKNQENNMNAQDVIL